MKIWIAILLKSTALFFLSLLCIKVLGKKRWAKITPFNLINYMVIAALIALISTNVISNWVFGIIALAVWVIIPVALDYICMRSKFIYDLINGKEIVVIKNGKVMEENLGKIRYSGEDLLRELRSKSIFNLGDVEFAIMESTGDINVILKSHKKPVTPKDLGIQTSPEGAPQTVILDGNVINESLSNLGLNQGWLNEQLELLGISLDNVFIGQVNSKGELYVDLFDDMIQVPQLNLREMLYAHLEKAESDLMSFALDTQDKNAKNIYEKDSLILKGILEKLKAYLLR